MERTKGFGWNACLENSTDFFEQDFTQLVSDKICHPLFLHHDQKDGVLDLCEVENGLYCPRQWRHLAPVEDMQHVVVRIDACHSFTLWQQACDFGDYGEAEFTFLEGLLDAVTVEFRGDFRDGSTFGEFEDFPCNNHNMNLCRICKNGCLRKFGWT